MVENLVNRFVHHAPKNNTIVEHHEVVRSELLKVAQVIDRVVPEGREKSLAITKLEEAMFWANAGIARQ